MIEGLQIAIPQRMAMVRIILVFSLIASVLVSFSLWGGQRYFPLTPLTNAPSILPPYDYILPGIAVFSWLCSLVLRKHRLFLFLSLTLSVWMCLNDYTRLQPWFYMYNAMLVVFILYNGRVDDPNKYTSFFIILQIILASNYFFTGFHRLHSSYIQTEFVQIISPLHHFVSERQFTLFVKLGASLPYVLLFIGVGLMISPVRYLAITLAVLMHVALLFLLFPSARQTNYALWLTNASYPLMVLFLFSGKTKQRYYSPAFLFQKPLFYIVLIAFVVMPFFSAAGYWPRFMSSDFRNGRRDDVIIVVNPDLYRHLSLYERHFYTPLGSLYRLEHLTWCREELNAEFLPDKRIYESIQFYLNSKMPGGVTLSELEDL